MTRLQADDQKIENCYERARRDMNNQAFYASWRKKKKRRPGVCTHLNAVIHLQ